MPFILDFCALFQKRASPTAFALYNARFLPKWINYAHFLPQIGEICFKQSRARWVKAISLPNIGSPLRLDLSVFLLMRGRDSCRRQFRVSRRRRQISGAVRRVRACVVLHFLSYFCPPCPQPLQLGRAGGGVGSPIPPASRRGTRHREARGCFFDSPEV